jgi:hypothetical protein
VVLLPACSYIGIEMEYEGVPIELCNKYSVNKKNLVVTK